MRVGCDLPYFQSPVDIRAFAQGAEALGYRHSGSRSTSPRAR
jgi:hypothetical protein